MHTKFLQDKDQNLDMVVGPIRKLDKDHYHCDVAVKDHDTNTWSPHTWTFETQRRNGASHLRHEKVAAQREMGRKVVVSKYNGQMEKLLKPNTE